MGLAKASLEANVRYLASCLGPEGIRVNGISAGPIKTLAAAGIGGFSKILRFVEANAPLRRNVTTDEVGNVAAFLLSDLASGITGEITYVDCGFSTVAAGLERRAERRPRSAERAASTPSSSAAATTASPAPRISRAPGCRSACSSAAASLGGAAVTEEFHPGFRNSTASYTVSLLDPQVIRDLRLARARARDHRAAAREFPAAAGRRLSQGRRRPRGDAGGGRDVLAARRASAARRTTRCSIASPTCCASSLLATPPNFGRRARDSARCSTRGRSRKRFRALDLAGAARRARSLHQERGRSARSLVRDRRRSRRRSASTPSSATSRAPTRRAPPTCCCITCSAK